MCVLTRHEGLFQTPATAAQSAPKPRLSGLLNCRSFRFEVARPTILLLWKFMSLNDLRLPSSLSSGGGWPKVPENSSHHFR